MRPLPFPPIAYSLPFAAAARPKLSRAVGIGARLAHVFALGSYTSLGVRSARAALRLPIAYTLPSSPVAAPNRARGVGIGARIDQASAWGS
jgi:hypothetical protein